MYVQYLFNSSRFAVYQSILLAVYSVWLAEIHWLKTSYASSDRARNAPSVHEVTEPGFNYQKSALRTQCSVLRT